MLWDECTCTLMICSLLTVCSFSLVITPKLPLRPCLSWADSLRWGMRDLRHSRTPIRQWRLVSSSTGITMSKSTYEMLNRILYHLYMEGQVTDITQKTTSHAQTSHFRKRSFQDKFYKSLVI